MEGEEEERWLPRIWKNLDAIWNGDELKQVIWLMWFVHFKTWSESAGRPNDSNWLIWFVWNILSISDGRLAQRDGQESLSIPLPPRILAELNEVWSQLMTYDYFKVN